MTKKEETNLRKIKKVNLKLDDLGRERDFLSCLIRGLRKELKILIRK